MRNFLQDMCGSGGDLRRSKQLPDLIICWPEIWIGTSKGAKKQGKQDWALEKPKLDNAQKLRGIYFIYPEDEEFKETIKMQERS